MPNESAYVHTKRLGGEITRIMAAVDLRDVSAAIQSSIRQLKRELADTIMDVRDYELAETRTEQQRLARRAHKGLARMEQLMLALSQNNIFSALEIVELSARIDLLTQEVV